MSTVLTLCEAMLLKPLSESIGSGPKIVGKRGRKILRKNEGLGMSWYLNCLKKYVIFEGRARRTEYWMFLLFNIIFMVVAIVLDNLFKTTIAGLPYGVIYFLYAFAVFIPSIAVIVRRLHDVDKSGTWVFIAFIPFIGSIWLLVLECTEGTRGKNQYGADPKA